MLGSNNPQSTRHESPVFEQGMAYVALSRVKTLSGLILSSLNENVIKPHDDVLNEYHRLRNLT